MASNLAEGRSARLEQQRQRLSKAELEIQKSLSNKVDVKFNERPLSEVMDMLSELSGVPIVLDPVGMAAEGVTSDTPVTIRLNQQISLRSALNLVLAPLRLSYVIQDEVLRVTSEQTRDSNVYHKVYNVADLVIPIPNFIPGYNTGLAGAIQYAHSTLGYGSNMAPLGRVPMAVNANDLARSLHEHVGAGPDGRQWHVVVARRTIPALDGLRPGRHGRCRHGRLRHAHRTDHQHDRPRYVGRSGWRRCHRTVPR